MTNRRRNFVSLLILIAALSIAILSAHPPQASEQGLNVAFLDVGQGDAILLTTPNRKHILVDGGPDSTVLSRLGEELRFPERKFDLVVATHNDADHITGVNSVLDRYAVEKLWINGAIHTTNQYIKLLQNIQEHGIATEVVWRGKSLVIDGVTLDVLHPQTDQTGVRPQGQNDLSIVLRVTYGETRFLLTGDIDEPVEQTIVKSGEDLKAQVLKVPHHGSKSGLALNFLSAVSPQYAVIQVGADNRFGHPAPSIITKLQLQNVNIYRTDTQGTVRMFSDGQRVIVQ